MNDIDRIVERANSVLDLRDLTLGDEYSYQSLTLCLIDAVWSIGVRYPQVQRVVLRYCENSGLDRTVLAGRTEVPEIAQQESMSSLRGRLAEIGPEISATQLFRNRQRTSSTNGILKSVAIYQIATVLIENGIEYFQDVPRLLEDRTCEKRFCNVPGQASGKSFKYFLMLAGSEDLIKPDRMIERFLADSIGRIVSSDDECVSLLREAASRLSSTFPQITARRLDYKIWNFESKKTAAKKLSNGRRPRSGCGPN